MLELETRIAALATRLTAEAFDLERAGNHEGAKALRMAATKMRGVVQEWCTEKDAPKPRTTLFPRGHPLTWRYGVHQALFMDSFLSECLISEGIDDRVVIYLGRKESTMAVNRPLAGLLFPILQRFAETGEIADSEAATRPVATAA